MAPSAVMRLSRGTLVAFAVTLLASSGSLRAQEAITADGPAFRDEVGEPGPAFDVAPAAAQAEAIPEVTTPEFVRPEISAAVPPPVESFLYLKKSTGRYTMLAGTGQDLGMDIFDGETTFAFRDLSSFTVSPSAGVVFLDGPNRPDMPPRLYTGQVEFRWFGQIATPVFYELAFMPAVFTDGENTGSDALRMQGRGVGYLAFSEQTQLVLGATYLDREDVPILPVFGVLHSPREDLKVELVFPRPRILERVSKNEYGETWVFAGGELGGGSWAIERRSGREDVASYRDYRLTVGLEQRNSPLWTASIEAGYVFGRALEYESGRGDYDPDDTFLLRLALSH